MFRLAEHPHQASSHIQIHILVDTDHMDVEHIGFHDRSVFDIVQPTIDDIDVQLVIADHLFLVGEDVATLEFLIQIRPGLCGGISLRQARDREQQAAKEEQVRTFHFHCGDKSKTSSPRKKPCGLLNSK